MYKNKTPKARMIMKMSDMMIEILISLKISRPVADEIAEKLYDHAIEPEFDIGLAAYAITPPKGEN